MLGNLGLLLGLALLIYMALRGVNIFIAALVCAMLVALSNGVAVPKLKLADTVMKVTPNSDCATMIDAQYRVITPDGTAECHLPTYRETLPGGRTYTVLDLANLPRTDKGKGDELPAEILFAHRSLADARRAAAAAAGKDGRVLVFGSFHTVAEALASA
mgnify:CR=1 FL=1